MPRLTSLARLSNWPFALKMAFCPALAMLALMALGLYGVSATDGQATLIHTVVQRDLALWQSKGFKIMRGIVGYRFLLLPQLPWRSWPR